jgi:hypothetical protein
MSDGYLGNERLKKVGIELSYTEEQVKEIIKCTEDPVYFIRNYVQIVNVDKGLVPFDMWPFQEKMVQDFHENRFSICKMPRQVGKTTTTVGYMLWCVLFQADYTIGILANKGQLAQEILSRLQKAYEYLPLWLQQGVIVWNKRNIELENGSKIYAYATSNSGVRGGTYNCISGDSKITIKIGEKIFTEEIKNLSKIIANSSKYSITDFGDQYVLRKQIHKNIFSNNAKKLANQRTKFSHGKTSHDSKIYGWHRRENEYCLSSSQSTFSCPQSFIEDCYEKILQKSFVRLFKNDKWSPREIFELESQRTDTPNKRAFFESNNSHDWQKTLRRNEKENIEIKQRENCFTRNQKQNFREKQKQIERSTKNRRTQEKNLSRTNWFEKIFGPCKQNKQKSRENKKDSRKTSWYEKIFRESFEDEFSQNWKNTLEQRNENENDSLKIKVLTSQGFKKFNGVKRTKNQKTIKLYFANNQNLVCTEDHKIYTKKGWKNAKECLNENVLTKNNTYENIYKIEDGEVQDVFDLLEVEDTHSFFANNILVHNCIFLDEFAFVPHNMATEFFTSTYPVISSGQTSKVIIVSTPNGLNLFYKMWTDAIEGRSTYKPIEVHWSMVPGRDEKWKEETIRNTSEEQFRQEFETEFIGSSATLVSGAKLRSLAFHNPLSSEEGLDIYEQPKPNRLYICTVDCAEGVEHDYSSINVIDVSEVPYRQVAKYRNNKLPLLFFPTVIYSLANRYNEAFVLIETNNIGQQVVDIMHYDLEYENIYKLDHHHIKGQTISGGFKKSSAFGIRTTKTVKKIGCANLKTLIENDKLIINDFDTIAELNTFVRIRDSYAAEEGNHDDLVMGLVLFGWLAAQTRFKDETNIDIRRVLLEENSLLAEEDLAPVGIIDDGLKEEVLVESGDVWSEKGYFSSKL